MKFSSFFAALFLIAGTGIQNISYQDLGEKRDSTYFKLSREIEIAKQSENTTQLTKYHTKLGEYYANSNLYMEAIEQYKIALKYADKSYPTPLLVDLKNDVGSIYNAMNNYKAAILFFEEAIEDSDQIQYFNGKAKALAFTGTAYEKLGSYLKALEHQNESLALYKSLKDSIGIAMVYENIGSVHEDLENYDLAYSFFKDAYSFLKDSDTKAEANVLNNIGDVHRKSGDYEKALFYTQKSLDNSIRIQDLNLIESGYKDLSKTHALLNNYKEAYEHKTKAETYREKALLHQNNNQINTLQTAYQAEKKEAQIQLLEEQNKVNNANLTLMFVITIAAIAVFFVFLVYYRKKRKNNQKIATYRERVLKAELEKKEIEEKNLHNDIQLKVTALSRYSLHVSQKNKILYDLSQRLKKIYKREGIDIRSKIKEIVKEIEFDLKQENEWEEFKILFKDIHPSFVKELSAISKETLSPAELKLGVLLRLNMSSKEIASILRVTPDSVRVARYRLRKKLPIDSDEDLVNFMLSI